MNEKNTTKYLRGLAALGATAAIVATPLNPASADAAGSVTSGTDGKDVSYYGLSLTVPVDWDVVDLAARPDTCVRLDRNTVYLGHPGADQDCPTRLIGPKTDALVIEPVSGATARTDLPVVAVPEGGQVPGTLPTDEGHEVRVTFEAAGLSATASHSGSTTAVQRILASATVDGTAPKPPASERPAPPTAPSLAAVTPSTGYKGKAFDACAAPSNATMSDWAASPYRGVGIYIGGPTRVCAQPNLTASWIQTQTSRGWHMLPIYAGLQASGISSGSAAAQGRSSADKAADLAKDLGFANGTVLYTDMEQYSSGYRTNVLNYLSGWSQRIRELGFRSGVYSSSSSGIKDLASVYNSSSYHRPDVVWVANWNGQANTNDVNLPSGYWADRQRVHQYAGNVTESYGGTSINIDRNYMDVGSAVSDPGMTELAAGEFSGGGKNDLLAVQVSTGKLFMYPNTGGSGLDM
ncbi:DUF1906 domain-containing protein, partial [Streptomyces sp. NRRL F-5135]|uniref:DUF1906 domain-containing protein n=1 Tax=Streptomyces sp. NRRL F-5135 TaxID=1463858 RepID=UPI00068CC740